MSARLFRGSDARAILCVACSPRSFRSHTCRFLNLREKSCTRADCACVQHSLFSWKTSESSSNDSTSLGSGGFPKPLAEGRRGGNRGIESCFCFQNPILWTPPPPPPRAHTPAQEGVSPHAHRTVSLAKEGNVLTSTIPAYLKEDLTSVPLRYHITRWLPDRFHKSQVLF